MLVLAPAWLNILEQGGKYVGIHDARTVLAGVASLGGVGICTVRNEKCGPTRYGTGYT